MVYYTAAKPDQLSVLDVAPAGQDRSIDVQAEAASEVKTACLVNLANCAHKEQQYGAALDWCNKALR